MAQNPTFTKNDTNYLDFVQIRTRHRHNDSVNRNAGKAIHVTGFFVTFGKQCRYDTVEAYSA